MKALFLKDIYIIRFQAILTFFFYFICQCILFDSDVAFTLFMLFLFSFIFIQVICRDTYIQDEVVKWDTYQMSMPIKKTTLVNEKIILLILFTVFIFLVHIVVLSLWVSSKNWQLSSDDIWFIFFEVYALIALSCLSITNLVNNLISNDKYDCILPNIVFIFIFVVCGIGYFALFFYVIPDVYEGILTSFSIPLIYVTALALTTPGFFAAYIFCKVKIGKREYS